MEPRRLLAADLGQEAELLYQQQTSGAADGQQIYRSIVPDEVIVALRSDSRIEQLAKHVFANGIAHELSQFNAKSAEEIVYLEDGDETITVAHFQLSDGSDVDSVIADLLLHDSVAWAAPNYQYTGDILDFTPNDPRFGSQYHHTLMDNDIAWDTTMGDSSIIIAVTDDGVQLNHSDLAASIWTNALEIPGNSIDDDNNGYVDDVNGWDFVSDDNDPNPVNNGDDHGTHVAGIAAGVTNNGIGISGTAGGNGGGGAQIMPLRIAGSDGGFTSMIMADAFRYAIDNGAVIANTSYNINGFVGDPTFTAGLQYYYDNGGLHFNSAGNGNDLNPPRQAFHQTLLVANTTSSDTRSGSSNYGTGIDVAAPGSGILSTITNNGYGTKSGTSMAAPNAAGVAALVWSANPTWTRDQVAAAVLGTADNIDAQNPSYIGLLGSGRVNSAGAIVGDTLIAPPQVESLVGLPADGAIVPVTDNISGFTLRFDQVMDPATINDVTNITLAEVGPDGAPGGGDDVPVPITAAGTYMIATNDLVYSIDSAPLGINKYVFTIDSDVANPFGDFIDANADGTGGDAYQIVFEITQPPLETVLPLGSLIQDRVLPGTVASDTDVDSYTISLDAGQVLTVVGDPDPALEPTIEVLDPNDASLGTASGAAGVAAILQSVEAAIDGEYTITVQGASGTTGGYQLHTIVNAATELESYDGAGNDVFGDAENIDTSDVALGFGTADRLAVVGELPSSLGNPVETEDFESGALDGQWTTNSTHALGRIQLSGAHGTAAGSLAMLMDVSSNGNENLNEAIWTVDLSGTTEANLRFFYAEWNDENATLPQNFVGSFNGDGVAISDDGNNWYTVLSGPQTNNGEWTEAIVDLDAAAAAAGMTLGANFRIKFQQYDNFTLTTDGRGYDEIEILVPAINEDWYEFTLDSGESATIAVTQSAESSGSVAVELYADDGTTQLASGVAADNANQVINSFVATTTGTHYARVLGNDVDYSLLVTRESNFDVELNDDLAGAQELATSNRSLGHVTAGESDHYQFLANAGDPLSITTMTPADGPLDVVNNLDPVIELYDPTGTLIGSDDNGAGGNNALLNVAAGPAGVYTARVLSTGGTEGEYVVDVSGSTAGAMPFQATSTTPLDGAILGASPTEIVVDFNDNVLLTSLQESDLTVGGVDATGYTIIDGDTISFEITPVGSGVHTISIAAGALTDLQGTPIDAFSAQFEVDTTGPRIISSSIQLGDVVAAENVTFTAQLDEPLAAAPGAEDILLVGDITGGFTPTNVSYVPGTSTVTVEFGDLPQDTFTLTLVSGDGAFEDVAGNDMDGEPITFPLPPNVSGDGNAGGDFVVSFDTDITSMVFPSSLSAQPPLGSLVFEGTALGPISTTSDVDTYTIDLDAGQAISVLLAPDLGLTGQIELVDPSGSSMTTSIGTSPGEVVVIQSVDNTAAGAGTYSINVSSPDSTLGDFSLTVLLNAAVELESVSAGTNDTIGTAQNIDGSSVAIADATATRSAVVGDASGSDDYFTFTLQGGQPATLAVKSDSAVSLDLVDSSGTVLAQGIAAANLDQVITAFVPTATDTFGALISGSGAYNLIVTRNSDFDSESNSEIETAQLLQGGGTALGHIGNPGAPAEGGEQSGEQMSEQGAGGQGTGGQVAGGNNEGNESSRRIIVQFDDEMTDYQVSQFVASHNATLHQRIKHVFNGAVLDIGPNESAYATAQSWESLPEVTLAEVDQLGEYFLTPDDPQFGDMWGLNNTGQTGGTTDADIDAPEAWDLFNDSSSVVIAIVDSGVNYNHPDLNGAMWVNPLEIPGNNTDDDNNGFIDDVYGINADTGTGDPMDGFGHGTHVAGTTAAIGNNTVGVTGVNWNAEIMALGIGTAGPSQAAAIIALDYMVDQKINHGVNVVSSNHSYSVGAGATFETAIQASIDAGVVFVAAAGNSSLDIDINPTYPASYPFDGIITVAATDHNDAAASFTNTGATSVDLGAPGVDILSTMLTSGGISDPSGYGAISGTSMASPHVAGAAALLAAANPSASVADIKTALMDGADPIASMSGVTVSGGRLNLRGALELLESTDDFYSFQVTGGDDLLITTTTPLDDPLLPGNTLDPFIELFDPSGTMVDGDDNGAADGRNASLAHQADQTGTYTVRVSNNGVGGEYTLQVSGDTGLDPVPTIVQSSTVDGEVTDVFPTTVTLTFNEQLLLTTVQETDVTINGTEASNLQIIDGQTFEFTIPAGVNTGDGAYTIELAAGSVMDLQQQPNQTETISFIYDTTAPNIVSTLWNASAFPAGGTFDLGALTFEAQFSEAMLTPGSGAVTLTNTTSGDDVPATSVLLSPDDHVTAQFPPLAEADYQLTLSSADGAFEDLIGNDLDGEPVGAGLDLTPTGDTIAGGDYVIDFTVDIITPIPAAPFARFNPLGSLLATSSPNTGSLFGATDTDSFTFTAQAGEIISAAVLQTSPSGSDTTAVELVGIAGPFNGDNAALPPQVIPADGTYEIRVSGSAALDYELLIFSGGGTEYQVGDSDDTNELQIDNTLISLGPQSARFGVIGRSVPTLGTPPTSGALFGLEPIANEVVQIDPATGNIVNSYLAPTLTTPSSGLSGAENGTTLIVQSDFDPQSVFRIDPVDGALLSTEYMDWGNRGGLSFEDDYIFATENFGAVYRQDGFGGSMDGHLFDVSADFPGALGGDDNGRQFVLADGLIQEFDPFVSGSVLNTFSPPAGTSIAGLAFDGATLFAFDTANDELYLLDPNDGSIFSQVAMTTDITGLGVANVPDESEAEADVIVNGSFESGDFTGWMTGATSTPFLPWAVSGAGDGSGFGLATTEPQDGSFVAWHGFDGEGPMEFTMYQDVIVPPIAELSFQYRAQWDFTLGGTANVGRTLDVQLLDPSDDSVLATLHTFDTGPQATNPTGDTGWLTETADLSAYAGQSVRLMFRTTIPESNTGPGQLEFDAITLDSIGFVVADVDEYTVDLTGKSGELIDIVLDGQGIADFSTQTLELLAPDGTTVLATATGQPLGTIDVENYDLGIIDFSVPADGIYTLRLTSLVAGDYGLIITDPLSFDTESNDDPVADPLRDLTTTRAALGSADAAADSTDSYLLDLTDGQRIVVQTDTPFDGADATTANSLDAEIVIRDSGGAIVAQDQDSAADGRNAYVQFAATGTDTYTIQVNSQNGAGEYFLEVNDDEVDDFGDAPGPYPTLLTDNGARHDTSTGSGPTLGPQRDAEADGQPSTGASADDTVGMNDEDGVMFGIIGIGNPLAAVNVDLDLHNATEARVDAWIDFDGNGIWEPEDQILDNVLVFDGLQTLNFTVRDGAVAGNTYARVRVSSAGNLDPTGPATDGEVEDYLVTLSQRPTVEKTEIHGDASIKQRSNVSQVVVTFDSEVDAPESAFTVKQRGSETVVDSLVVNSSVQNGKTVSVLTFEYVAPGGLVVQRDNGEHSLVDGNYQLDIDGTQITKVGGGPSMYDDYSFGADELDMFFRMFSDHDGDRDVDTGDLVGFANAFRTIHTDPDYDPRFDFDADLDVDTGELVEFANRFRNTLGF